MELYYKVPIADSTFANIVYEKEVHDNYTMSYDMNEWQYIILNTYKKPPSTPETTTSPVTTTPVTTAPVTTTAAVTTTEKGATTTVTAPLTTTVSASTTAVTTAKTKSSNDSRLPQTGQTWWPVIPFAAGGIVLIGAGIKLRKRKEDE